MGAFVHMQIGQKEKKEPRAVGARDDEIWNMLRDRHILILRITKRKEKEPS